MYIRECLIHNVGPITNLDLSFGFNAEGLPKPIILVGKNGTGKTLVLAYLVDALAELAKKQFGDVVRDQRLGNMPFLKVTSTADSRSLSGQHLCLLEFSQGGNKLAYVEKVGRLQSEAFAAQLRGRFGQVASWPTDETFHKKAEGEQAAIRSAFEQGVACYFPAFRNERPHWLNTHAVEETKLFASNTQYEGQLRKPLLIERAADSNHQWLMDVLLDSLIDGDVVTEAGEQAGSPPQYKIHPRRPFNDTLLLQEGRKNLEQVLRLVLEDEGARVVIGHRNSGPSRISIHLSNQVVIPSLQHLSAGQSLLFNLFSTIIRYADRGDLNNSIHLENIEGLVLIDEVDAHLHADLQYRVLPSLLRLFPKVQFVLTSHAPLFLLGMEKQFGSDGVHIVEMPHGSKIGTERFSEFQQSFEAYRLTKTCEQHILQQVARETRPLVLTEGQTDACYIKTALTLLGHGDILESIEVDQVGSSTNDASGVSGGGHSHLSKAATFLRNNSDHFRRPVLLLYDGDTNKPDSQSGRLSVRKVPHNADNARVRKGIENLLPEALFAERFYAHREKPLDDGGVARTLTLDKEALCRWVCEERRNAEDFAKFETFIVPILRDFLALSVTPG